MDPIKNMFTKISESLPSSQAIKTTFAGAVKSCKALATRISESIAASRFSFGPIQTENYHGVTRLAPTTTEPSPPPKVDLKEVKEKISTDKADRLEKKVVLKNSKEGKKTVRESALGIAVRLPKGDLIKDNHSQFYVDAERGRFILNGKALNEHGFKNGVKFEEIVNPIQVAVGGEKNMMIIMGLANQLIYSDITVEMTLENKTPTSIQGIPQTYEIDTTGKDIVIRAHFTFDAVAVEENFEKPELTKRTDLGRASFERKVIIKKEELEALQDQHTLPLEKRKELAKTVLPSLEIVDTFSKLSSSPIQWARRQYSQLSKRFGS